MRRPPSFRAFFLTAFACTAAAVSLFGQDTGSRVAPRFLQDKRDDEEGARALAQFRQAGLAGDYWLEFELRVMPRKGAERVERGQLYGTMRPEGPWSRLVLPGGGGVATEKRWLFGGNRQGAVWSWSGGKPEPTRLESAELFAPIGGTDITLFDLQMPFLDWSDAAYEGLAKVRGRPAHTYLLQAPPEVRAAQPGLAAVRVSLDGQFLALVQAVWLDAYGKPTRSVSVLEVKKLGEQWIVKSVDVRNARTRDKTRFTVTAAALNQRWTREAFEVAGLGAEDPLVPSGAVQRF
jgi:hypothetical protein